MTATCSLAWIFLIIIFYFTFLGLIDWIRLLHCFLYNLCMIPCGYFHKYTEEVINLKSQSNGIADCLAKQSMDCRPPVFTFTI